VAFSNVGSRPLRRLLSSYSLEEQPTETRNEIFRLAELLASSRQAEEAVSQVLSVQVLSKVLSGGVLSQEEEESLLSVYPAMAENCRIAIVHTTDETEEFGQSAITELLSEHLPEQFAVITVNNLESGVLFPDDADALHLLAQVLSGMNHQLKMDGISVQCGVSAPFSGAHSAYAAVRQARFSIPIRESSFIEVYSAREDGDDRPGVFSWLTHERLYQAVMKNDRTDTVQFIRTLGADKYYSAAEAKEVFYNVRFVVRSTAGEMRLPLPEADTLEYREEMRPKDNFRKLEELAGLLFERLGARQAVSAANALENVVRYIDENFSNPDLSAVSVATHFSLPQKTVYAAVRERADLNFNDYLISVRMKEAARLLCTTAQSVDEIGEAVGYPAQSTFYRVFKKYYGESPNRYRSLHPREE
jgi:AraC-like DNA-binding protein